MSWLAVKAALQRAWAWCKKYWQLLVGLAIPAVVWALTRDRSNVAQVVERVNTSHKEEVDAIDRSHQVEQELVQQAQQRYEEKVTEIEAEHEAEQIELDETKRRRIRQIVKRYGNKPDEITRRISALTGIPVRGR